MNHKFVAQHLSKAARDLLLEHIDGGVFVDARVSDPGGRHKTMFVAASAGLIRFVGPGSYHAKRPQMTRLTDDGRAVLAVLLSWYAEALIKAGFTGLESPASLAVDLPPPVIDSAPPPANAAKAPVLQAEMA